MAKLNTRSLGTPKVKTTDRTKIVKEMLSYHEPAFCMLNEDNPLFYPKCPFIWNDEETISMMKAEIISPIFYTEIVNADYTPKDPNRTLYKFRGNINYINEYFSKIENGITGEYSRYFVPLHEFERVDLQLLFPEEKPPVINFNLQEPLKTSKFTELPLSFKEEEDDRDNDEDSLMTKLTIRDHAAIQWKLPVSKKEWLNKLIKQVNNGTRENK